MKLRLLFIAFLLASFTFVSNAQFDDLYDNASSSVASVSNNDYRDDSNNNASSYDDEAYDDYNYDDDDSYKYGTRLRRFSRPYTVINYYSPIWGLGWNNPYSYYDNYYGGNTYVIIGNNYGSWNRYNRWNNWNSFGCGYNSWNNWGNNWGYSPFGYANYYSNNYYGYNNGWYGNYYNNGYGNGGYYNHGGHFNGNNGNNNNNPNGTYYGSRKLGSSVASTQGRVEGPRREASTPNNPRAHTNDSGPVLNDNASPRSERASNSPRQTDREYITKGAEVNLQPQEPRASIYNRGSRRSESTGTTERYNTDTPQQNNSSDANTSTPSRRRTSDASPSRTESSNDSGGSRRSEPSRNYDNGGGSSRSYDGGGSSRSSSSSSSSSGGGGSSSSGGGGGSRSGGSPRGR
jgi:hypothetical protein